jgi:death-on-curing protein
MRKLTRQQVILLHSELIKRTGGTNGIRDESLLDSALNAPFQGHADTDYFPSLQEKAARLGIGLVRNHAFVDGNKRLGAHIMLLFLSLNHIELEYTQDELSSIFLKVASGGFSCKDLFHWDFIPSERKLLYSGKYGCLYGA